jgi:GGDEF domain-containing protein
MQTTLAAAVERRRRSGERATLLMFDIDRFKDINDTLATLKGTVS